MGRFLLGFGLAAIGAQNLPTADFLRGLQPVPDWVPAQSILACLVGLVLVGAGALVAAGRAVAPAAGAVAALLFFLFLTLHLPRLLAAPGSGGA